VDIKRIFMIPRKQQIVLAANKGLNSLFRRQTDFGISTREAALRNAALAVAVDRREKLSA
jgi:hypothetical protein